MPRAFVIQTHSGHGPLHYDLMLESGRALATWQLPRPPDELEPGQAIPARRLADHRLEYLSYEGPVSRGRGHVKILDRGTYELLSADDRRWEFAAAGRRFAGRFELTRRSAEGPEWQLRRQVGP